MTLKQALTSLVAGAVLATGVAKADVFIERDRTADVNPVSLIGFSTNTYKFDETAAKIGSGDQIAAWGRDHPASNVYVTGHKEGIFGLNNGEAFKIPSGLNQTLSYTNLEAGNVYVTQKQSGTNALPFKQSTGVLFYDSSKGKYLNTKVTGENNTLNTDVDGTTNTFTYIYSSGNISTNVSNSSDIPEWSSAVPFNYKGHVPHDGTNTITLQTHFEPRDRTQDTNVANPSLTYVTNVVKLIGTSLNPLKRGDELAALVQDKTNSPWYCVDRRVFQESPTNEPVYTFIIPQLNSTNASGETLERRVGLAVYNENLGEMKVSAIGVGSSKSTNSVLFSWESNSGHKTDMSNFQTTNGYLSTEGIINEAEVIAEPSSLVGGLIAALLGYFSRKQK